MFVTILKIDVRKTMIFFFFRRSFSSLIIVQQNLSNVVKRSKKWSMFEMLIKIKKKFVNGKHLTWKWIHFSFSFRFCQFLRFAMNFHQTIDDQHLLWPMLNNGRRKTNVLVGSKSIDETIWNFPFFFQLEIDSGSSIWKIERVLLKLLAHWSKNCTNLRVSRSLIFEFDWFFVLNWRC